MRRRSPIRVGLVLMLCQHCVVHGEELLAPLGRDLPRGRAHAPTSRPPSRAPRRPRRRTRGGRRGAGRSARRATLSPAPSTSARTSARLSACRWPMRAASARLAGRAARAVVLQRHLDQHARARPARPRAAAAPGRGRARARARAPPGRTRRPRRDARAVVGLEPPGARDAAPAGDLDRRRGELEAVERRVGPDLAPARAAASRRRSRSRPRARARRPRASAQRAGVGRLGARAQRAPAAHPHALLAVGERVARGVERRGIVARGLHERRTRPHLGLLGLRRVDDARDSAGAASAP